MPESLGPGFHWALIAASAVPPVSAGRGNADEIAVVHDNHARHRLGRLEINRCERCTERRRPKDLPEEHARKLDVGRVLMAAGHKRPAVDFRLRGAGDRPARRLSRAVRRNGLGELLTFGQLAELELLPGAGMHDGTARRSEQRAIGLPGFGRQVDQDLAQRPRLAVSRCDISGVVRLPNVPMSNGVNCVSAITRRIDSGTREALRRRPA